MEDKKNVKNEEYSLNDDRRVKVLSPGAMVAKRFFRNRIAVVGLSILAFMFLFSFVGGLISPYSEKQFFYRYDILTIEMGGAKENSDFRFSAKSDAFDSLVQANTARYIGENKDSFEYSGKSYTITKEGENFYSTSLNGEVIGYANKALVFYDGEEAKDFDFNFQVLKAFSNDGVDNFEYNGSSFKVLDDGGIFKDEEEVGYVSTYSISAISPDITFSRDYKDKLIDFIESNDNAGNFKRDGENESKVFIYNDPETGEEVDYVLAYNAADSRWVIKQQTSTKVYDSYAYPSSIHWLGTDGNGMDMLTRLMYGGRVSLVIGFIVVIIETILGVILGGISGYFGSWIDNLIMRIVDVMYCIPSTPIIIIIGAAMDAMGVDPTIRMIYLMLILGFLGWPSVARLVRGQILSLREQEFMTATEATGLSVSRRIFKHLVPNVIPQLIVTSTMGVGSTIITEATLSFLGLGVKFPFASWGNIINDVNNTYVLTTFLWVWIPAGMCILLTVLAFNLVGDGLRDAFDPRMKR